MNNQPKEEPTKLEQKPKTITLPPIFTKLLLFLQNPYNIVFLSVLIIAAYLRFKFMLHETIWNDAAHYAWMAKRTADSPLFLFSKEHFQFISQSFSIITALFIYILQNPELSARLVVTLSGLLGIFLAYKLGEEIENKTVGILASILLTFNTLHWFHSDFMLLDVPIATALTLSFYSLIKFEKDNKKYSLLLALSLIIASWTKIVGLLAPIITALYFLIKYKLNIIKILKEKPILKVLIISIIGIAPIFILNFYHYQGIIPESYAGALKGTIFTGNWNYYIQSLHFIFTSPIIALLLYISIILSLIFRKKSDILLLLWFFTTLIFFSFFAGEKDPRYILGLIPAGILLISLNLYRLKLIIEQLTKLKISAFILIALVFALAFTTGYSQGENFIKSKTQYYTGYQEAGNWIRQNTEKNAIFYMSAGTARQIRLFSQIEFDSWGGRLASIPNTREDFEELTKSDNRPIYIVQDAWEFTQPSWIYPITQDKAAYLENIGFIPVKTAQRTLFTSQGPVQGPAVIVFKRQGLPA